MEEESKSKKRAFEDLVHILLAVPRIYVINVNEEDSDDDTLETDTDYKLWGLQGYKDEKLSELFTAEYKAAIGIEGPFTLVLRDAKGLSRKGLRFTLDFPIGVLKRDFSDEKGECMLYIKPSHKVWYRCIKMTQEEIVAAREVINGCEKRRCKKPKLITENVV